MSWGEREEGGIHSPQYHPRTCLWRGAGRLISSYQWDLTVQCLKALGWKQLREAEAGGKGCEPVCAASLPSDLGRGGERRLGSRSAGGQADQTAGKTGDVNCPLQPVAEEVYGE